MLPAAERIRATVLGASEYTVQLSGITSFIPSPESTLPRRNLQVARPEWVPGDEVNPQALASAIERHLTAFGLLEGTADIAVALHWSGAPEPPPAARVRRRHRDGAGAPVTAGLPIYLMIDADVALTLGTILRDELSVTNDLLILDGISLRDFDFVDLGRVRHPSNTVPVTDQIPGVRCRTGRHPNAGCGRRGERSADVRRHRLPHPRTARLGGRRSRTRQRQARRRSNPVALQRPAGPRAAVHGRRGHPRRSPRRQRRPRRWLCGPE